MPSKPRNEFTPDRVSKIASKVLSWLDDNFDQKARVYCENKNGDLFLLGAPDAGFVSVGDLKSLAASALTQTKDKPKGKRK